MKSALEVLREIREHGAGSTPDSALEEARIVEARHELGAVRVRSPLYGEVWVVLTPEMEAELRAEEAGRDEPRAVLAPADIAALRGKPESAVRAVLEVAKVFPGARVIQ